MANNHSTDCGLKNPAFQLEDFFPLSDQAPMACDASTSNALELLLNRLQSITTMTSHYSETIDDPVLFNTVEITQSLLLQVSSMVEHLLD